MGGPWVAWPEQHVEKLRELWMAGNSAGQIANIIGAGYSRNAVIGKLSRLGLTGRTDRRTKYTTRGVRKSRKRKQPSGLPMPSPMSAFVAALAAAPVEPLPMPDAPAPADQRRSLLELEPHHCRWPIGDTKDPDFHFCGATKVAGMSYFLAHARKAYQPPQPRRSVPVAVPVKASEGV